MSQSRRMSLLEQVLNLSSGFVISLLVWEVAIKKLWHIDTNFQDNLAITSVFTVVSLARGYVWRRAFNWLDNKKNKRAANEANLRPFG